MVWLVAEQQQEEDSTHSDTKKLKKQNQPQQQSSLKTYNYSDRIIKKNEVHGENTLLKNSSIVVSNKGSIRRRYLKVFADMLICVRSL